MPTFQCRRCGKKVEADYEACDCAHPHNCYEQRHPLCCGRPMLEIVDD